MNKYFRYSTIISLILLFSISEINAQNKPLVSLSDGNYWIYYKYSNYSGIVSEAAYVRTVSGDTLIDGKTWKILKDKYKTSYFSSDEEAFYGLNNNNSAYVLAKSNSKDSILCFGKKYPALIDYYHNYPYTSITSTIYCGLFGYWSDFSYSGGAGGSSSEQLMSAKIDGVLYGRYLMPLIIRSWNVNKENLNINFEGQFNYEPHSKIIIYKGINPWSSFTKYDSVQTTDTNVSIDFIPRSYCVKFSYRTADGKESGRSEAISFTVPRTKGVISVAEKNYWIYSNEDIINGAKDKYYSIYRVVGDAFIANRQMKKINIVEIHDTQTKKYDTYIYSDTTWYCQYDKNGKVEYNLYCKADWNRTGELFGEQWPKNDSRIDTAKSFINNSLGSASDVITVYDRLGIAYRKWVRYTDNVIKYQKEQKLVAAQIEGKIYGKLIPPILITDWRVISGILSVRMDQLYDKEQIERIIVYKYSEEAGKYEAIDSVKFAGNIFTYKIALGDNKLKLSFRTKSDVESMLSESISFTEVLDNLKVYQNYPNPFNGQTKITFELGSAADVDLEVINVLGQRVYSERKTIGQKGYYEFNLRLDNQASGVYFYSINTSTGYRQVNKMILMK